MTILIVDDNPTNLLLACDVLEYGGHSVTSAHDAQSALQVLKVSVPDLILMDVQMPGMDGLALTRQLRADPAYQDIRIVALSAHAMLGDEEKGIEAGCDAYITKPFDTRTLNDQLIEILNRPRAKPEGA